VHDLSNFHFKTYVHTNPALFTRNLAHLQKMIKTEKMCQWEGQ